MKKDQKATKEIENFHHSRHETSSWKNTKKKKKTWNEKKTTHVRMKETCGLLQESPFLPSLPKVSWKWVTKWQFDNNHLLHYPHLRNRSWLGIDFVRRPEDYNGNAVGVLSLIKIANNDTSDIIRLRSTAAYTSRHTYSC